MDFLTVKIKNTEKVVFEGDAKSVSSVNSQGPFDILPYHADFITLTDKEPIIVRLTNGEKQSFDLRRAVIYNHDNLVSVYTL